MSYKGLHRALQHYKEEVERETVDWNEAEGDWIYQKTDEWKLDCK